MSNVAIETYIADEDSLISRQETQEKLTRVQVYLTKVQKRLKQLERQRSNDPEKEVKKRVEDGLRMMDLKSQLNTER